jgi:hypothetical protein
LPEVDDTIAEVVEEIPVEPNLAGNQEDPEKLRAYGFTEEEIAELTGNAPAAVVDKEIVLETAPVIDTPNPTESPLSSTELETLKAQAQFGKSWADAFESNPTQAMLSLLNSEAFKPEQKAAFVEQFSKSVAPPAPVVDPTTYEPQSELEKALMPQLDWVTGGKAAVTQALASRDRDIEYTFAHNAAIEEKVDALLSIMGVSLPAFDVKGAFDAFAKSPESNLRDVVRNGYGAQVRAAAEIAKQKKVERPDSLRNVSGGVKSAPMPKSMAALYGIASAEIEASR